MTTPHRIKLSTAAPFGRERDLMLEAFDSGWIAPAGPMLTAFEQAFCAYTGIAHACAVGSGTAALHLALRTAAKPDGEVWASSFTFIGSVVAAYHDRHPLVFLDCDPQTWCMDAGLLAAELDRAGRENRLPSAVLPTDLFGQSADLDALGEACVRWGVPLIADSAEGMGALYKGRHAGKGATVAAFSFNGNKIMTTGNGGMIASDDRALIDHARKLSTQAREPVVHYEHTEVGFNYRLSNILAAIGLGQLEQLETMVARRRAIFERYRAALAGVPGISFMPEAPFARHTRWLTTLTFDPAAFGADRETVRLALDKAGIETRPVWKPMHMQPVFREARRIGGAVCEAIFARGLCLPSSAGMSEAETDDVIAAILACRQ
jgi:dTDP-4-amino-4,6-dideoxygalactose transaminase